ncbi:hypothetical protein [Succinimonas sp.]
MALSLERPGQIFNSENVSKEQNSQQARLLIQAYHLVHLITVHHF